MTTTVEREYDHASSLLQDVIRRNRNGEKFGVYAICSAHPSVIDKQDWAVLHGLPHGCIDACIVPPTLLSQYLPSQYEAVWSGRLPARSEDLIREHIRVVLRLYATACGA